MARARTVFFFRGGKYVRYDIDPATGAETVNVAIYPRDISDGWTAMPASFRSGIDAALTWFDGMVYLFKGSKYVRWDATNDTVDANLYPRDISAGFKLPASFQSGVDAAINWGDGRCFFFKGSKYVRYDVDPDTGDESVNTAIYPRDISEGWSDFPSAFAAGIDAAVNWGNGTAYFFKGGQYLSYDIASEKVNPGYPLAMTTPGKWPALVAAGFSGPFDEVIEWPQADVKSETLPSGRIACTRVTQPRIQCGGGFAMHAVFRDADPSIPACAEYRQYVRGTLELDGSRVEFVLSDRGLPVKMRERPGLGMLDDNFREDGQPASRSGPFAGTDVHYGHRDTAIGNRNLMDLYLPKRRSGAQYEGRDFAGMPDGEPGQTFKIDADFRGQLIDVCNGGAVLSSHEWTVTCEVP